MKKPVIKMKPALLRLLFAGFLLINSAERVLAEKSEVGVMEGEGARIFNQYCMVCHDRGNHLPGTQNLARIYGEEKGALEDRDNLTPEFIRYLVRNGRGLMPGFRPTEINKQELDALAAYLASGPHPENRPNKTNEESK